MPCVVNDKFESLGLERLGSKGSSSLIATHYILLYTLVRLFRPRVAVEFGTLAGCSAAYIAQALKDNIDAERGVHGHLWTFDDLSEGTFPVRDHWQIAGLSDFITFTEGDSRETIHEVAKEWYRPGGGIQFAYIDGGHCLEVVEADARNVVNYADSRDAVIAFHDINRLDDCDKVFRSMPKYGFAQMFEFPCWGEMGVVRRDVRLRPLYTERPEGF